VKAAADIFYEFKDSVRGFCPDFSIIQSLEGYGAGSDNLAYMPSNKIPTGIQKYPVQKRTAFIIRGVVRIAGEKRFQSRMSADVFHKRFFIS
jgi:hypothetical protein